MDFDPGILAEAMVLLRRALGDHGLQIEFISDIHEYKKRVEQARAEEVDPQFSPDLFDFHSGIFVGLLLLDSNKKIVGGQSLRLESLGSSNLKKIIFNQQSRLYGRGPQGGELTSSFSSGTEVLSGQIVYHGGFWVAKSYQRRSKSGFNTGAVFIKYAHLVSLAKWNPDYIYGYMKPEMVYNGLAAQYWIPHVLPCLFQWDKVPDQHHCSEWEFLCYITRVNLVEQASFINDGRFLDHQSSS